MSESTNKREWIHIPKFLTPKKREFVEKLIESLGARRFFAHRKEIKKFTQEFWNLKYAPLWITRNPTIKKERGRYDVTRLLSLPVADEMPDEIRTKVRKVKAEKKKVQKKLKRKAEKEKIPEAIEAIKPLLDDEEPKLIKRDEMSILDALRKVNKV